MSILTRPVVELASYILTKLHGGFLLDQFDHKQLKTNLVDGVYMLKDLRLNPEQINRNLKDSPLHISKGSISQCTLKFPSLLRLASDPTSISIQGAIIEFCSAKESGFPVLRGQLFASLNESEEDLQGVTLLTKAIGNFLSSTSLKINVLIIRIRNKPTDKEFIQISIPSLQLIDLESEETDGKHKLLTIKGLCASVLHEEVEVPESSDYSNICSFENDINFRIKISRELLKIDCEIDSLNFIVGFDQMMAILRIALSVQKSYIFIDEAEMIVDDDPDDSDEEIKQAIENTENYIDIRKKEIILNLSSFNLVILINDHEEFRKTWDINFSAMKSIPGSYLYINLASLYFFSSHNSRLRLGSLQITHNHLVNQPNLDSSEMFKSARESFNSDFFRSHDSLNWSIDSNAQHFCINSVISIKPVYNFQEKYCMNIEFTETESRYEIGEIDINIDNVLLESLKSFHISSNKVSNEESSGEIALIVDIPIVKLEYRHYNIENHGHSCCCEQNQLWSLRGEIQELLLHNSLASISLKINLISLKRKENNIEQNLLSGNKMLYEIRKIGLLESYQERKKSQEFLNYYVEGQGDIQIFIGNKAIEPYSSLEGEAPDIKYHEIDKKEEYLAMKKCNTYNKLELNSLEIRIDPKTLKKLISLIPKSSSKSEVELNTKIDYFSYTIENINIHLYENLDDQKAKASGSFSLFEYLSFTNCFMNKINYKRSTFNSFDIQYKDNIIAHNIGPAPFLYVQEDDDIKLGFKEIILYAEQISELIAFFDNFSFSDNSNTSSNDSQNATKINFAFENIYFDYLISESRLFLCVQNSSLWSIISSPNSSNFHFALDSAQLFIKYPVNSREQVISISPLTYIKTLQSLHFALIFTLTDLEIFFTSISKEKNIDDIDQINEVSPPFIECMLGSAECKPILSNLYVSQEVRCQILKEEYLEVHANVGCWIIHLCKDTIDAISSVVGSLSKSSEQKISKIPQKKKEFISNSTNQHEEINLQSYLEESDKPLLPPPLMRRSSSVKSSQIYHTHLNSSQLRQTNTIDSQFHQLQPQHGFPKVKISLSLFHLRINLYSGKDFNATRAITPGLSFICENLGLSYSKFPQIMNYSWRLALSIEDFEALDRIKQSTVKQLISFDKKIYRNVGSQMLQFEISGIWLSPAVSDEIELIVNTKILPLKISVDQHLLDFCIEFIDKNAKSPPEDHSFSDIETKSTTFIQRLFIDDIFINLDYIPHKFNKNLSGANLLNIIHIEDLKIHLPKISITSVRDFQQAIVKAWSFWIKHLKEKEFIKFISGICPLSTIKHLGSALYEIAKLPYYILLKNISWIY